MVARARIAAGTLVGPSNWGGVVLPGPGRTRRPQRATGAGWVILGIVLGLAVASPALPLADPNGQDLLARLKPPIGFGGTMQHPLGTDGLGRDLLARLVAGARISLLIGVVATVLAGTFGVGLGLLAGLVGGLVDGVVSWLVDVQLAVPFVVLAIVVAAVVSPGLVTTMAVLAATGWIGYARIVRLRVRSLRSAPFVEAARAMGATRSRVAARHLLPNIVGPVVILASQQVGAMILYEAALSYLGLGVPPDIVTWGGMIAGGRETLVEGWWVSAVPGIAIGLTVLSCSLIADRWTHGMGGIAR